MINDADRYVKDVDHEKRDLGHGGHDKGKGAGDNGDMKKLLDRIGHYLTSKEEWVFVALILGFSLQRVTSHDWGEFAGIAAGFCLELSPILTVKFFQPRLKTSLSRCRYTVLKLVVFGLYPATLVIIDLSSTRGPMFLSSQGDLLLAVVLAEALLLFNHGISQTHRLRAGVRRFGFDRALILVLLLFAYYLAALIVSDLPAWYQSNSLGATVDPLQIAARFPLFLWLGLQLFALFMCGFLIYWVHRHLLVKQILARAGVLIYLFASAALIVVLYPILTQLYLFFPINHMSDLLIPAQDPDPFSWRNGIVATAVLVISLPVALTLQWQRKINEYNQLEKERISTELDLLKQQINPHFFFNTLNNLYALCLRKSDQAPEVVMQLSELMRYVVYEGRKAYVPVSAEVSYIQGYIALHQLRLHKTIHLDLDFQVLDEEARIAPLLLIILVENAFKHGIEPATEHADLEMKLRVEAGLLHFSCANSLVDDEEETSVEGGVGLKNLERRLALLYPNRYRFRTVRRAGRFVAVLEIGLEAEVWF